jgi:phospholipid/cholesterol/gamma-HCH transport system substrate-binding protein
MRIANEVRVGVVVVLALTIITIGYFVLRGIGLGADLYYMRLNGAATIARGNDVRLQGVRVGQVQEVTLDPDTQKPLLTLAMARGKTPPKLLKQYRYSIQPSSLIGESYVDIRGPYDPAAPTYEPNNPAQLIPGQATGGIAGITDQATQLAADFGVTLRKFNVTLDRINKGILSYDNQIRLAKTLDNVTKLTQQVGQSFGPAGVKIGFGDPAAQRSLNQTLANTAVASRELQGIVREAQGAARNINQLTGSAGSTLNENRGQLRAILGSFNRAANNVAGLTETLDFALRQGGFKENAQVAFQSLRRSAENVEAATAGFRTLSNDPGTQKNLRDTINALRESTEALRDTARIISGAVKDPEVQSQLASTLKTLNTTATTLQQTTENLRDATAGFKNVIGDPKVQDDLKAIPAELRGTLEATRGTAERFNSLLGGRRNRNGGGGAEPQQNGYAPGGFDFTYRHLMNTKGTADGPDNSGRNYGDVNFNTELFGGPFRAGLAGIGDSNDITVQSGQFLGKSGAVRYGIYRSKLGVGADYRKGRFSLEGNLYDPNNSSYNIYGGIRVAPKVEVLLGHEKIRGVRGNSIGVRLTP